MGVAIVFRCQAEDNGKDNEGDRPLLLPGEGKHAESFAQLHAA